MDEVLPSESSLYMPFTLAFYESHIYDMFCIWRMVYTELKMFFYYLTSLKIRELTCSGSSIKYHTESINHFVAQDAIIQNKNSILRECR